MPVKVFFDGGCRPNPGVMEIAVVAAGQTTILRDLGHGTSLDAEWLALIEAAKIAQALERDTVLLGDAIGVIAQANGVAKRRAASAKHLEAFDALTSGHRPRIRYIKRTQNLAGIALARLHDR